MYTKNSNREILLDIVCFQSLEMIAQGAKDHLSEMH